jgi:modulator of FtsH protease
MRLNTAISRPESSILASNKVLKNTYMLLSMTLIFSAMTAGLSMYMNLPPFGMIVTLVGFYGLFFLTAKFSDSSLGLLFVFALTGFMGLTLGPILTMYVTAFSNGHELVMMALGGTGVIFLGLSGYALTTRKDFSYMGHGRRFGGISSKYRCNCFCNTCTLAGSISNVYFTDVRHDIVSNQSNH